MRRWTVYKIGIRRYTVPSNGGKEHKMVPSFRYFVTIVEIEGQQEISFECFKYLDLKLKDLWNRRLLFLSKNVSVIFEEST